jgi:hypothetical protein
MRRKHPLASLRSTGCALLTVARSLGRSIVQIRKSQTRPSLRVHAHRSPPCFFCSAAAVRAGMELRVVAVAHAPARFCPLPIFFIMSLRLSHLCRLVLVVAPSPVVVSSSAQAAGCGQYDVAKVCLELGAGPNATTFLRRVDDSICTTMATGSPILRGGRARVGAPQSSSVLLFVLPPPSGRGAGLQVVVVACAPAHVCCRAVRHELPLPAVSSSSGASHDFSAHCFLRAASLSDDARDRSLGRRRVCGGNAVGNLPCIMRAATATSRLVSC